MPKRKREKVVIVEAVDDDDFDDLEFFEQGADIVDASEVPPSSHPDDSSEVLSFRPWKLDQTAVVSLWFDFFVWKKMEENQSNNLYSKSSQFFEVFEIQDFTCATSWERLIASIVRALKDWGLNDGLEEIEEKWMGELKGGVLSKDFVEESYDLTLE